MLASYFGDSWIEIMLLSTAVLKVFHVLYHFKATLLVPIYEACPESKDT